MVAASKQDALLKELNLRQETAVMAIDFYYYHQVEYTEDAIAERYVKAGNDLKKYVTTVPLTRSITHQIAKMFSRDPQVSADTQSETVQAEITKTLDRARFFGKLKMIDRQAELHGMIGVIPVYNPITDRIDLDLLPPDRVVVQTYQDYPNTAEMVMIRLASQHENIDVRAVNVWAIWTADTYAVATLKTDYTVDQYIQSPIPNPYGRIPIAWFSTEDTLDGFWNPQRNVVIPQNLRTNLQLSALDMALDYQAFSTLVMEGNQMQPEINIGITRYMNIPKDPITGQTTGKAYYINPQVDLRQVWEIINQNIDMVASLMGLSTSATKQSNQFSSGYQLKLSMQGVIDHNADKQAIYRESIRDLLNLICDCVSIYSPRTKLPKDIDFIIKFADIQVDTNPIEDEQINSMRLTQKTTDRAEILTQRFPDMTREEAEERIAQIDAAQPTFGRPATGFNFDVFNED